MKERMIKIGLVVLTNIVMGIFFVVVGLCFHIDDTRELWGLFKSGVLTMIAVWLIVLVFVLFIEFLDR